MEKIAFIFPGQGAQYPGMGKDFYEGQPVAHQMFQLAQEVTGLDMVKLCFTENEQLNITEYTQIAMLAVEVAILKVVEEKGIRPTVTAGLSLGEYGALIASGILAPADGFRLIRQRGILMQEAVPTGGAMAAVIGLDNEIVKAGIDKVGSDQGIVTIANYNCPGQVVITGDEVAVAAAMEVLVGMGARKCIPLKVSGPFHSPLMSEAGQKLHEVLGRIPLGEIRIPYIANVTADYVADIKAVPQLLAQQVSASVKWQQTIERMIADGITTLIEIGPGKTLSGFIRKINREVKTINVENMSDIAKLG
ncbi:MAG: ACP S-malonyltransferase [Lachnospiraceae bacterium]|jgi:[acyl-carrier-protein] S-malonyltransferase|nr:ACP S-malonyltransferase [Lachnospiraceae bacterium]